MLTDTYFRMFKNAQYKPLGKQYRYEAIRDLVNNYDRPNVDIAERGRVLCDALVLLNLAKPLANGWKFTDLKNFDLAPDKSDDEEPRLRELADNAMNQMTDLKTQLYSSFKEFERYWRSECFKNAEVFLDAFYWYAPYAKIDIDQEIGEGDGLARVRAIVHRVQQVFLANAPSDLPEGTRDSLIDYAVKLPNDDILGIEVIS